MVAKDAKARVRKILERHKKLKIKRDPWLGTWQLIGEMVRTLKQDFQGDPGQGQFLTGQIFDGTAPKSNAKMASCMQAMLFPSARKTFRIGPPEDAGPEFGSKEVKKWYEDTFTTEAQRACDNEAGGLATALGEYYNDLGAFGTCGTAALENYDSELPIDVRFHVVDVRTACIDEGFDGRINTVYIEKTETVRNLVAEYGIDNVSKPSREAFNKGEFDKTVKCLHAVEPRLDRIITATDVRGMPYVSANIEVEQEHELKPESGFTEMPYKMSRFMKAPNEIYGRGPSQEAMPDIIEVNCKRETLIVAEEKILDPPLAMLDDGAAGGATLDTSAGALNVRMLDGFMRDSNRPLVEQIFTIQDITPTKERIVELQEDIKDSYYLKEFLGLMDITKRMTLGEANMQNDIRMLVLSGIFARQIQEHLLPLIERVAKILLGRNRLGVFRGSQMEAAYLAAGVEPVYIPDVVAKRIIEGKDFFKVTFISPAARIMRNEELFGIQKTMDYAVSLSQVQPDVMDNFDTDAVSNIVQDLTGAPSEIMRSKEEIEQIRQARAQQQQQAMELQMQQAQADIAKSQTQAAHSAAKAQKEQAA